MSTLTEYRDYQAWHRRRGTTPLITLTPGLAATLEKHRARRRSAAGYGALARGEVVASIASRDVVVPAEARTWALSLLHPLRGPKTRLRCGSCGGVSRAFVHEARELGQPLAWSVATCRSCGDPNAVPWTRTRGG